MEYKVVERWAKSPDTFKGDVCINGCVDGGPGYFGFCNCEHPDHESVRYGVELCPSDCKDFSRVSDERELFRRFRILMDVK